MASDEASQECDNAPEASHKRKAEFGRSDTGGTDGGTLGTAEGSANKKPRVVWSVEMHQQFVTAVNQLGIDKAVPKKILELMAVDGLTRENVASHLQKYRWARRHAAGWLCTAA